MTTVAKGKVKGEGRIISLNDKFGFLGAQGIKSKVFIIPSSLKADPPFPKLTDVLDVDDIVYFEAVEQPERNGAKYLAIDGSVRVKQRGRDVMHEGEGKIVQLDKNRGYFGFIEADIGNVFFNISAVRPSTNDVTKVLKVGQKVKFRCLPNSEQPNCKWRASLVVPFSKANEFMRNPQSQLPHQQPLSISKSATSAVSRDDSSGSNRPKSTSLSDYGSGPGSPLMFNTCVTGGTGTPVGQQAATGCRSHVRSISPIRNNGNSIVDGTHRHNINNGMDSWASRAQSPPQKMMDAFSNGGGGMVNEFHQKDSNVNASAMWDTFLQQQQALLHPWYAEGRENFYILNSPPNNGYNYNSVNDIMDGGVSARSSDTMGSNLLDTSLDKMDFYPSLNLSNCIGDPAEDGAGNADGNGKQHDSICRQMLKLAHELNGWKDDGCPFCCNTKLY